MRILLLTREESSKEIMPSLSQMAQVTSITTELDLARHLTDDFDLTVSWSWGPILKQTIINSVKCPILNIHPSFLPYGRGIYPVLWAAYEGNPQGVSLFQIVDEGIDTGPILAREAYDLDKNLTLRQAREYLLIKGRSLLFEYIVNRISSIPNKQILQDDLGKKTSYRSRVESISLFNQLPAGWDTRLQDVRAQATWKHK